MMEPLVFNLWAYYEENHVRRRSTPKGQETAAGAWRNLEPVFGRCTVDEVRQERIDDYLEARAAGLIGKPSKPVTVRRELLTLQAALRYCAVERLFPVDQLRTLRLPQTAEPRRAALTLTQVQQLLDAAASARHSDNRLTKCERFIWLALQTGARKTAILNLTWDRVNFESGFVDYREPGRPPTKKRRAVVAMSSPLRPVLERAFGERISNYVLDNNSDTIWAQLQIVAARAFGGPSTPKGKCPRGMGVGPHVFRHTAATLMARAGVSMFDIGGVLANTPQVVERTYAHYAPADPSKTVDRISGANLPPPR